MTEWTFIKFQTLQTNSEDTFDYNNSITYEIQPQKDNKRNRCCMNKKMLVNAEGMVRTQVHFPSTKVITTIAAYLQQPTVAPS